MFLLQMLYFKNGLEGILLYSYFGQNVEIR